MKYRLAKIVIKFMKAITVNYTHTSTRNTPFLQNDIHFKQHDTTSSQPQKRNSVS